MESLKLGDEVNGIVYQNGTISTAKGKINGFFLDPHGRQFVQLRQKNGKAVNVDRFTVNASTADRKRYEQAMKRAEEIQKSGNEEIERMTNEIVERSNAAINEIYAELAPLIDATYPESKQEQEQEDSDV